MEIYAAGRLIHFLMMPLWMSAFFAIENQLRMARQRVAVSPAPVIIIDDVRYPNEAEAVRQFGGRVVMITGREDASVSAGHASERFAFEPDLTFYNIGSVLDMERWITAHLTR